MWISRMLAVWLVLITVSGTAGAQSAKAAFGAADRPSGDEAAAYGSYARGCIAGAVALAGAGAGWQTMRPSRNRAWGHPDLIAFVERLGERARALGWPRLLIGDLSQPRGGPMTFGHRSHQIGLDADIWFRQPPAKPLDRAAREKLAMVSMVAPGGTRVTAAFRNAHIGILRAAATDEDVARIFVNAAIKGELCRRLPPDDRAWLRKIRPWWGHDGHFHVRLACPVGSRSCIDQAPPPPGDGCGDLAWWFSDEALNPRPRSPSKPRGELTLGDLPAACRALLGR